MGVALQNLDNATPELLGRARAALRHAGPATDPPPTCRYCDSTNVVRAGTRKTKSGSRQLYRCNDCLRRFSLAHTSTKRKPGAAVLDAVGLVCQGYSYSDAAAAVQHKHRVSLSPASICRWVKEFDPPYLAIRRMNRVEGNPVRSHVFVHGGIQYAFRVHLPKLKTCPLEGLRKYLIDLPRFLDHARFEPPTGETEEEPAGIRCSQADLVEHPAVRHLRDTALNKLAAQALSLNDASRNRHAAVENYLLCADRNTIAVETPVYFIDSVLGSVTGHIDILQWNFQRLWLLDFKPKAAKEKQSKVMTQLSLYATALCYRARLSIDQMRAGWFDESDLFTFNPQFLGARKARTRQD